MIAIHTKYLGPSNTRGARVKAYAADGRSCTIGWGYDTDSLQSHFAAVQEFARKFELSPSVSEMAYGDSADGRGYVFCFPQSIVEVQA